MKTYTLFWLTGDTQLVEGNSPHEAMNNAGIGSGALRALDFWAEGDKTREYLWNKTTRSWDKYKDTETAFEILEREGIDPAEFQSDLY